MFDKVINDKEVSAKVTFMLLAIIVAMNCSSKENMTVPS
jgi:hypothetical protein